MTDSPVFNDDLEVVSEDPALRKVVAEPETPEKLSSPPKTAKFKPTGAKINVYQPFLKQPTKLIAEEQDINLDEVVNDPEPNEEVYEISPNEPEPAIFPNSTSLDQIR